MRHGVRAGTRGRRALPKSCRWRVTGEEWPVESEHSADVQLLGLAVRSSGPHRSLMYWKATVLYAAGMLLSNPPCSMLNQNRFWYEMASVTIVR